MGGDLVGIIPAIEKVITNKEPQFVSYSIKDRAYIALIKNIPDEKNIVIVHEAVDTCGIQRRKRVRKMLTQSADELYTQLLATNIKPAKKRLNSKKKLYLKNKKA